MASEMLLCANSTFHEVPHVKIVGEDETTTAAPSPPLMFCANLGWSRQSTEIPALRLDGASDLTDASSDGELHEHQANIKSLPSTPEDSDDNTSQAELQRALSEDESGELSWDEGSEETCRRIVLTARCLARAGREDEDGEVGEAELEKACRRMGLAARRLALSRQDDEDCEVDEIELEAAATRMGMLARSYALSTWMGH
mmetsp:Transcript_69051/g.174032  ORF Transcript_69051/g.174032 Transcript_69051/m.174032 type:complete len:200 (-) Transcript_69051:433-1032(-)